MAVLKKGDKGAKVKALQKKLNKAGAKPKLTENGIFDDKTETAVKAFQKKSQLKADGKVGSGTMEAFDIKGKPPKWNLKDTAKAHKQINQKIADLKKDRKLISGLAKKNGKNKELQNAYRNYNIYADPLAKQMTLMKEALVRVDFLEHEFKGSFDSSPKERLHALSEAQDTWKDLEKRNKDTAKLEKYYIFEHDNFLKVLDSVPA